MKVILESNKYALEDFLKNKEIRQGIVELFSPIGNYFIKLFLFKLEEGKNTTSIFCQYSYEDNFVFTSNNGLYFLLSIDYKNKVVIHDEIMGIELGKELEFLKDEYEVWYKEKLSIKAKNEYKDNFLKKIQENLIVIEKDEKFVDEYNKTLKDYEFMITNEYLRNPDMGNYELYIRRLDKEEFLEEDNLKQLRDYLTNPLLIKELVEKYYEEDAKIRNIARIEAKNFILKNLRNNPNEYIKLSLKIREAIQKGGKTLNIETKDGTKTKVESYFNGREFKTVVGWAYVDIEDIKKITFNRKVLFLKEDETED